MSKSTYLKAFNNHLLEMINDILDIYPDNVEIKTAKISIEKVKQMNPTIIIKAWYSFVYIPYKEYLDNGDLSYFFEKDYRDDLSYLKNTDDILKVIDNLRQPLKELSNENKEHTAAYLKNLNKLSEIYNNS